MVTNINKMFSGCKPRQLVKNHRHFRDHLCPIIRAVMMGTDMIPETSVIFNQLTLLIARGFLYLSLLRSLNMVYKLNANINLVCEIYNGIYRENFTFMHIHLL
jgi:hypothetical protein